MSSGRARRSAGESRAADRFLAGAVVGLVAGGLGFVLPVALVLLATYAPGELVPATLSAIVDTSVLALLASVLFSLSLLLYRSAFAAIRPLDPRFWAASILCLVGTVGFVLIVVAVGLTLASSGALSTCLNGSPTQISSCLLSTIPQAAYAGGLGLALIWLGDFGVVVGLGLAGLRMRVDAYYWGAAAYAALLIVLAGPILAVVDPAAPLTYPLLAGPFLVLLAPTIVAAGSQRASVR